MASVSTYLNYMGKSEEAFNFYASVFQVKESPQFWPFSENPPMPGGPELSDAEKRMMMHAELKIIGGHTLMATDMLESMGHQVKIGNNTTINLNLDSEAEADRIYAALAEGSTEFAPMAHMPWGYWGSALDKYGIRWMFNVDLANTASK